MKKYLLTLISSIVIGVMGCHKDPSPNPPPQDQPPVITTISPSHGVAGNMVTISGTGFSTTLTDDIVAFNGINATVVSATTTSLTVTAPANGTSGAISVTVKGKNTTGPSFTYDSASITSVSPTHAAGGASITLTGTGFSTTPANNVVKINGLTATVTNATATTLTVTVPAKSGSGLITATVNGAQASSNVNFSYDWVATVSSIQLRDAATTNIYLSNAEGVTTDPQGNVYISNSGYNQIIELSTNGTVYADAGNKIRGLVNDVSQNAEFNEPAGLCFDGSGNLFVADKTNNAIRKIGIDRTVSTIAGNGNVGDANGQGAAAQFRYPNQIIYSAQGNFFYIFDTSNLEIRKMLPDGTVSTLSGNSTTSGSLNGPVGNALYNFPSSGCIDASGNLYITDTDNNLIRKITPDGTVSTFAGSTRGYKDDTGINAQFADPIGIAIDASGNLYVADQGNNRIRKITPGGVVTTFAGNSTSAAVDGVGTSASFKSPLALCIDNAGNIYVTDFGTSLRKITIQ